MPHSRIPSTQDPSAGPSPTLSIHLPFILIGTSNVPETIYSHADAESSARPLLTLAWFLNCMLTGHNLRSEVWVWAAGELYTCARGEARGGAPRMPNLKMPRREVMINSEAEWTEILGNKGGGGCVWVLRSGEPVISSDRYRRDDELVEAVVRDWAREEDEEEKTKRPPDLWGWIGEYREGDGGLTEGERKRLGKGLWTCPAVLQRHGVPMSRRDGFFEECAAISGALQAAGSGLMQALSTIYYVPSKANVRIVCGEACRMKVKFGVEEDAGWDLEMCKKIMLILAGFEKEMVSLEGMSSVLNYVWPSRFFEWVGVRKIAREQRHLYQRLRKKVKEDQEKETRSWVRIMQRMNVQDAVDRPELWRFVDDRVQDGDSGTLALLQQMQKLQDMGKQMSVGLSLLNSKCWFLVTGAESIIFHSHRSTLSPSAVSAYIDLVAALVSFALTNSYETLRLRIQTFRDSAFATGDSVMQSAQAMLSVLKVRRESQKFYKRYLETGGSSNRLALGSDATRSPFDSIQKYVSARLDAELKYMPKFVERYEDAGGFHDRPKRKLYALMRAQEERQKEEAGRGAPGVERLEVAGLRGE